MSQRRTTSPRHREQVPEELVIVLGTHTEEPFGSGDREGIGHGVHWIQEVDGTTHLFWGRPSCHLLP